MRSFGWALALATLASPAVAQQLIEITSRTGAGLQAEVGSHRVRLSADARYAVFATASAAFDPSDTNGLIDVYLKDRATGTVRRISRAAGGGPALGGHSGWDGFAPDQYGVAISDDGGRIAFLSSATNLTAADTNGFRDAFLWERDTDAITLLSRSAGGAAGNDHTVGVAISGDGNVVAFSSFANNLVAADTNATVDLFARVLDAGTIERVNLTDADAQMPAAPSADRGALAPSLSRDGRYVGFLCEVNLNTSDCGGQCAEMWVRDRVLGTTIQASTTSGEPGTTGGSVLNPFLSADGRYAAWGSFADMALPDTDSIGDLFFRDLQGGTTEHISQTTDGDVGHVACGFPAIATGGRFVAFHCNGSFGPDDGHSGNDIYLRDPARPDPAPVGLLQPAATAGRERVRGRDAGRPVDHLRVGGQQPADGRRQRGRARHLPGAQSVPVRSLEPAGRWRRAIERRGATQRRRALPLLRDRAGAAAGDATASPTSTGATWRRARCCG